MPRRASSSFRSQILLLMLAYMGLLLLLWPQARHTSVLPLKVVYALVPLTPMVWALWLEARRIMQGDELQQRVNLIALSVATGVVSVLSLAGGFLAAAGAVAFDGDILVWVMPALALVYLITRWRVGRRYGGIGC
jgi:hypothetical protein